LNSITKAPFASAADLKSYLDDFLEKLEEEPIAVYVNQSNYGAVTSRSIKTNGIFPALYKPSPTWSQLAANLAALLQGDPIPCYEAYSDSWLARFFIDESNAFVTMNDNWKTGSEAPLHGIKALQNFTLSIPPDSKLVSRYQASDIFNRASWGIPTTHNFHPQYHPEYPKFKTAEPILILSTSYDPVCPLISAKKAHMSFEGSGLVEQKSFGHCSVSMPSICTAKHVQRYFYEGILPKEGATCEIDAEYFPPPTSSISAQNDLNHEDAVLLEALQDLARMSINDDVFFRRRA